VKGKRLCSGSFFDPSLDPFADDDGFVVGKGRKRTKFARHSDSWRLLDRTPSPEKELFDLRLDDANGSTETAALYSQPQSPSHDVAAIDERPVDRASLESIAGAVSTVAGDTQPLLYLPGSPHAEVVSKEPDSAQSSHSPPHGTGQMQPPTSPPRRIPRASDMVIDSGIRKEVRSPARSDIDTPRLGPLPSPGLPLVSPLIRRPGLPPGYFPDSPTSHSELDASGDQQQSLPASERKFASGNELAPSPDTEQFSFLSPAEAAKPRSPEPEVTVRDTLFELSSPRKEVSSQLDQSVQSTSWTSFPEEVQQTDIMPQEQEQEHTSVDAYDFEFLNSSPMEANNDSQNMWHFPETSVGNVANLVAPNDAGILGPADVPTPKTDLSKVIAHTIPQYDAQVPSVPDDMTKSDATTVHVGGAIQDDIAIGVSKSAPDTSVRVPIDPILVAGFEAAAEFNISRKENTQVPEELPEEVNDSRSWSDKLNVSAVDAESQRAYDAPPFPFQQGWHRKPSSQRSRRSSQYTSHDGTSDEVSADELSEVEDMSARAHWLEIPVLDKLSDDGVAPGKNALLSNAALSPPSDVVAQRQNTHIPIEGVDLSNKQAPDSSQHVIVLDSSDEDANSRGRAGSTVKDDAISAFVVAQPEQTVDLEAIEVDDAGHETQMSMNKVHEIQADRTEDPALPPFPGHREPFSPAINTTAASKREANQTELSPTQHQGMTAEPSRPSREPTTSERAPDEASAQSIRYQLVTPESTQQERGDAQLQDHTVGLGREISLPPTPQNTQEYADFPQPTVELPAAVDTEVEAFQTLKMTLPTSVDNLRERRRSPRLSRKFPSSQDITGVVSPYFTPRRTSQMRAQAQLAKPQKSTIPETSVVATKDTIQLTEKESKSNSHALPDEEAILGSPLLDQPKAGLATSLSYYTPLSLVQDHFSQSVDVLALSTTSSTEPQKAKSGPRDWHTTIHLTERSLQGKQTITAQIFRPYKTALPKAQRGNLVLLRNFKVQSQKRKCMLLSTDSSAWAVFSVRQERGGDVSSIDAMVAGPPVEYGAEEKDYVVELKKWWDAEGEGRHAVQKQGDRTSKALPATSNGDVGVVNHQLRDGTIYKEHKANDEQAGVSRPYHELRDGTLYKDDTLSEVSKTDRKGTAAGSQKSDAAAFHELRDGTVYNDDSPTLALRSHQKSSNASTAKAPTHEDDVKTREESTPMNESQHASQEIESIDVDVKAEADSGDESPTNEAVSSQIYHELRNGRRYADLALEQKHAEELQQKDGQDGDESVVHELRDGLTYTDD
jgi:hypothetical protein